MSPDDLEALGRAKRLLESPSLAARLANAVGRPIEALTRALPPAVTAAIMSATDKALRVSLDVAVRSLGTRPIEPAGVRHKLAVAATGAIGGAFGLTAFALELPTSTTLMLRSIAQIARNEGESLESAEARLACLQVFALGGPAAQDDAGDAGYFAVRAFMAKALEEAAEYVAERGLTTRGAPLLVRFLAQIAARFGVPVSEKFIAQSVPVLGAFGGAAVNVTFLDHFQNVARGHFIVRRLERKYGQPLVRERYMGIEVPNPTP